MHSYTMLSRTIFLRKGILFRSDHSLKFCFQRLIVILNSHGNVFHGKTVPRTSSTNICQNNCMLMTSRNYSTKESKTKTGKEIDISRENPYAGLSAGEKAGQKNSTTLMNARNTCYHGYGNLKQASKDASYLVIILGGLGVMGIMFYTVGKELFSKQSPGGVYNQALKLCKKNYEVIDYLGEPITGHGTSGSRRRRQIVNSHNFLVDGVKHMRIQFYINGPYRKGTVHVEVYEDEKKKYQYKYVIVELDGYPAKTIVIEDNRKQ